MSAESQSKSGVSLLSTTLSGRKTSRKLELPDSRNRLETGGKNERDQRKNSGSAVSKRALNSLVYYRVTTVSSDRCRGVERLGLRNSLSSKIELLSTLDSFRLRIRLSPASRADQRIRMNGDLSSQSHGSRSQLAVMKSSVNISLEWVRAKTQRTPSGTEDAEGGHLLIPYSSLRPHSSRYRWSAILFV